MSRKVPPIGAIAEGASPSVDDVTGQLMAWAGLAMRLNRARPLTDSLGVLNDLGLTLPQLIALHVIAFEGPTTMTRLVERVGLSTSAVSALVHRLVEMGLCERRDDPVDRRQRRLRLTVDGQQVIKKLMQSRLKDTRMSLEPLSPATLQRLSEALALVIADFSAAAGDDDDGLPDCRPGDLDGFLERIERLSDDVTAAAGALGDRMAESATEFGDRLSETATEFGERLMKSARVNTKKTKKEKS
ncbi:MAG: MarR family transcriptional regulator [Deltaproteobacteria bacterium]|nr:MarR family transcriptional regulator [Deltaproteobacteria bacterium]